MSSPPPAAAVVEEVRGAPLGLVQAWALVGLGVIALLMTGLQSALLGALADEHRLSGPGVGVAATLEALTMAVSVAGASVALKPERLRAWGLGCTLALTVATLLTLGARNEAVYAVRAAAGVAEGLMLWLASSLIARTETPERWAAGLFLALSLTDLAVSAALGARVLPTFGVDGGYGLVAAVSACGLILAALAPSRLGPLPGVEGEARGAPPPRGWIGLGGVVLFTGATGALAVYQVPLGEAAGLSAGDARLALSAGLAAQIVGAGLAAALAGRIAWFGALAAAAVGYLAAWAYYLLPASTWPFVAATALTGLVAMLVPPFVIPMLIQADPTRRAALQSAGAQLLAAALGPLTAAGAVQVGGMRLMVAASMALLLSGLAVFALMRFTAPPAAPAP